MIIPKKLTNVANKSGTTSVNTKFNFKNQRLLSSMASSDKSSQPNTKNIHKVVNAAADLARSIKTAPAKTFSPASVSAIAKGPNVSILDLGSTVKPLPPRLSPAAIDAVRKGPDIVLPEVKDAVRRAINELVPQTSSGTAGLGPIRPQTISIPLPGLTPPSVSTPPTAPTPRSDDRISVFSSVSPKDVSVFKAGSFLISAADGDEKFVGEKLNQAEKPRILSVIEESIKDGYPKSNAIIIRRLISERGFATKYTIYRKDLFRDFLFRKLTVIESDKLIVPDAYKDYVLEIGEKESDVFVIRDLLVRHDAVYAYKIEVDWVPSGPRKSETTITATPSLSGLLGAAGRIGGALGSTTPSPPPTPTPPTESAPAQTSVVSAATAAAIRDTDIGRASLSDLFGATSIVGSRFRTFR